MSAPIPPGSLDALRTNIRTALGDSYAIERELGGGMSCVFVAEDRALQRQVVVKVLHPHLAASVSVERFRREILTVAALQHPHIVPVLSTGMVDGLPYFVMPYVDGQSLADRLHGGPLAVRDVVSLMKDVARALSFAHARGVVHRDIKPGNVLIAGNSAVVTDFGVAKALATARRDVSSPTRVDITTAGTSLGTLLYMAPEQAAADPAIDGRADIYALGITAYEMLAGNAPFADLSARAMLAARMSSAAPSVRQVRADVPLELDLLIRRCLAADPADRPQTADAVLEALERPGIASGEFVATPTPRRIRSALFASAGLVAITLLGAAFADEYNHVPPRTTPKSAAVAPASASEEIAVVPFVDLTSGNTDANVATGITNAVAGRLAGEKNLRIVSPSAAEAVVGRLRRGDSTVAAPRAKLLLEGTVQRDGNRLRVTARLSDARDGVMRWANVYDRDAHDVFSLTDSIAAAIATGVASQRSS